MAMVTVGGLACSWLQVQRHLDQQHQEQRRTLIMMSWHVNKIINIERTSAKHEGDTRAHSGGVGNII